MVFERHMCGRPAWPGLATRLTTRLFVALAIVATLVAVGTAAKVKVRTEHDKEFPFAGLRTYAWHPTGAGEFKMLQTTGEDPAALRARFEPVIKQAVEQALAARGFTQADAATADLLINYYVLIGPGSSSQYMGQFMASVPEWGLPAFAGPSTSFKAFEQGSLILDIISPRLKSTVWRGVAQAEIDRQRTAAERDKRIADGIREMLGKFPPKR